MMFLIGFVLGVPGSAVLTARLMCGCWLPTGGTDES